MACRVAFDLPTLMGYDSDHPASEGEKASGGVAHRFAGRHGTSSRNRSGKDHGVDDHQLPRFGPCIWSWPKSKGRTGRKFPEPFRIDTKEYIAQKEYIYPPCLSMRLVIDTFEFGSKFTPRFNTISISGYHIREAGSTSLQELAFTLYDGAEDAEGAATRP